jgi:hypothetical protein
MDLGIGELVGIREIWQGQLLRNMQKMEDNLMSYRKKAQKIASMMNMYRV